jgi:hypothetical protein
MTHNEKRTLKTLKPQLRMLEPLLRMLETRDAPSPPHSLGDDVIAPPAAKKPSRRRWRILSRGVEP